MEIIFGAVLGIYVILYWAIEEDLLNIKFWITCVVLSLLIAFPYFFPVVTHEETRITDMISVKDVGSIEIKVNTPVKFTERRVGRFGSAFNTTESNIEVQECQK